MKAVHYLLAILLIFFVTSLQALCVSVGYQNLASGRHAAGILTSVDGKNWQLITDVPTWDISLDAVTYGNGVWVAVGVNF